MVKLPSMEELLQAGLHFGHQTSRWHPKAEPYIFGQRNGIHIINLEKTAAALEVALQFVEELTAKGGQVLFVGTQKQAQEVIKKVALDTGSPYAVNRWLGGTLTNFSTLKHSLVDRLVSLRKQKETGELEKYTKKERLDFDREIEDLDEQVGGLVPMQRIPEAVFILDLKQEQTAFKEALRRGIKVIALTDTNINPEEVSYAIPGNDDALKAIEMITTLVGEAIKSGRIKAAEAPKVSVAAVAS